MMNNLYGSSIDYDNFFTDLKSNDYLKSFSQKRQMSFCNTDNQIRSNYQTTFQTQQNQDIYFSNVRLNVQPQNFTSQFYEEQYNLSKQQNSPPKNFFNPQATSYVPTFQSGISPPRSNSPPLYASPPRRSPSPTNLSTYQRSEYPLTYNNPYYTTNYNIYGKYPQSINNMEENQFPSLSTSSRKGALSEKRNDNIYDQLRTERYVKNGEDEITIQVWEDNLEEEITRLVFYSDKYRVIGYDCEFPGVIYQPKDFDYKDTSLSYPYLKSNVDNLQVIQVGFTLADERGNVPVTSDNYKIISWQFNFKFDLLKQPHNVKSIELLKEAGINFDLLSKKGIDQHKFGQMLLKSGLLMTEKMKWITFHSMFDYGYLIKMLIAQPLPDNESQFFSFFHSFFPTSFDVKYFFHHHTSIKVGGLESISKSFKLERKGVAHQAGSDSFLTVKLFFAILKTYRNQWIDQNFQNQNNGTIFGLNFNRNLKIF